MPLKKNVLPSCDVFGTTTTTEDQGDFFLLNGQKRFIVGGEGADFFLVYARTDPDAEPHKGISCFIAERKKHAGRVRDLELDAAQAHASEEKVFE